MTPLVTAWTQPGGPLSMAEVTDRLDEIGVPERDEDRATGTREEVSSPDGWDFADHTCGYVTKMINGWATDTKYPDWVTTIAQRALVDFGWPAGVNVQVVYDTIQGEKSHDWAGNKFKQRELSHALRKVLPEDVDSDRLSALIGLLKEHDEFR